jgi:hypothetical protein
MLPVLEKNKISVFSGLNDISHLPDQAFSSSRSWLITVLYLVYIRPLFEYACEVWDNCGIGYSDKLEKLQLDAARIVMLSMLPVLEKNKISVFSGLNDISHLLDQAFSSSRSWLITVFIWSTLWLEYITEIKIQSK